MSDQTRVSPPQALDGFKREVYEVRDPRGMPFRCYGWTFGRFGLDRPTKGRWHVTHLPTGWACRELATPEQAAEFIRRAQEIPGGDFTDPDAMPPEWGTAMAAIHREIAGRTPPLPVCPTCGRA